MSAPALPSGHRPLTARGGSSGRWFRLITYLIVDNFGSRYRQSRASALLAILEPLGIIAFFTLMHWLTAPHAPPFGRSFVLFYATGILPFYVFFHISLRLRTWDTLRRMPSVSEFDLLIVQVVPEVISKVALIVLVDLALWAGGSEEAIPRDPIQCLAALATLTVMGAAVGTINAVIIAFFAAWQYIYSVALRAWMVFSGVLFVVDTMQLAIRETASWVPVTHAIILYRAGHYQGYPTLTLDVGYMTVSTVGLAVLAWLLVASTRDWRLAR